MPSQEELNRLLAYDPLTGLVTYKICRGKKHAGQIAGSVGQFGYLRHSINNRRLLLHRIIWTMVYGQIPKGLVIDHINGDSSDNRLDNLRVIPRFENQRNTKRHKHNTSGVMGVRWVQQKQRWRATIIVNGNTLHLGLYRTFTEAVAIRKEAEAVYGFHANHGRVVP